MKGVLNIKKYLLAGLILFQFQFVFSQNKNDVYLFAYFKDHAEAGLHLAYSRHSYIWTALKRWTDISDRINFPKGTKQGTVFAVTKNEFNKLIKE